MTIRGSSRSICVAALCTALPTVGLLVGSARLQDPAPTRTAPHDPAPFGMAVPEYDDDGRIARPEDWRKWTFVGSSLGLGYSQASGDGPGTFKHVYIQPEAFDHYARTGRFPDKTTLLMSIYTPDDRAEPAENGWYPERLLALEAAVKDTDRFGDKAWGYFDLGVGATAPTHSAPVRSNSCFECHREHGQVDHVFVQFYPMLREARSKALAAGGR